MKKITTSILSLFITSGLAYAGTPCDGFEIKVKNNTADRLLVSKIKLSDGDIQPGILESIPAHSEQVFTVNHTTDQASMNGVFNFHSVSIPVKKAKIEFNLKNKDLICYHDLKKSSGDYKIDHSRSPGKVTYSID